MNLKHTVSYEALSALTVKVTVFWNVAPLISSTYGRTYSGLKMEISRSFGKLLPDYIKSHSRIE
jgi:hypothetical protein